MTLISRTPVGRVAAVVAALATAGLLTIAPASASSATDTDGDGMPNRWERTHGLKPGTPARGLGEIGGSGAEDA